MPVLTTRAAGYRWKSTDLNNLINAILAQHMNLSTNYLKAEVTLGDATDDADKGLVFNNLTGARRLLFNEAAAKCGQKIGAGAFTPFLVAADVKGGVRHLVPAYAGGVVDDPDGVSDDDGTLWVAYYDVTDVQNWYKWSVDGSTSKTISIVIRHRLTGITTGRPSFSFTHKTTDASADVEINVTVLDTADASATVVGGSALKSATVAVAAITLSDGTYTDTDYITIRIAMTAKEGKVCYAGNFEISYS